MWREFCCFCRHEAVVRDWAERVGWLEVECSRCGVFRAERQFWVAAHLKKARKPVLFRTLAHWLADHRERAVPPEIPFEGWEAVATALPNGR
jgi:hypothetical protein